MVYILLISLEQQIQAFGIPDLTNIAVSIAPHPIAIARGSQGEDSHL